MWGIILRMKTVHIRAISLICWSTVLVLCHSQLKPSSSIHLSQCEFTVLYDNLLSVSVLCISCSCPQIWRWPPCWNIDQTKHKEFQTMLDIGHLKIYFISPQQLQFVEMESLHWCNCTQFCTKTWFSLTFVNFRDFSLYFVKPLVTQSFC